MLLVAQQEGRLQLPNDNLDTGGPTGPAVYKLTDETYANLLGMTTGKPISDALRRDILAYYADLERGFALSEARRRDCPYRPLDAVIGLRKKLRELLLEGGSQAFEELFAKRK